MARDAATGLRGPGRQALVRLEVSGAGRRGQLARDFSRAQRQMQDEVLAVMRDLERDASAIIRRHLADHVEEDTGDLEQSIEGRLFARAGEVRFTIVGGTPGHDDPRPYLDVTRFGHRLQRVYPVRARALKVHYAGHRSPHLFQFASWSTGVGHPPTHVVRAAARGGGSIRALRKSFRRVDWLEQAMPEVDALADRAAERLGRVIARV